MADLLFILITVAFFAVCVAFVQLCDKIIGPDSEYPDLTELGEPGDAPPPTAPSDGPGTGDTTEPLAATATGAGR